ncbi:elongation factor P maturation arginine rhamnosyltransferase EarP [Chitinibacteraceae bacterium HSL-7]
MYWRIFSRVIDNYGDAGVCWRLARQLVAEYGFAVELVIDEVIALAGMAPAVDPALERQCVDGVQITRWDAAEVCPCEVVVEAFACELPEPVRAALPAGVAWYNLEYLSAEDWVAGCHGLSSPQGGGRSKTFFFPGFASGTGGLLRERDLLARAQRWQQSDLAGWLARCGIPDDGALRVSLFCYDDAPLAGLVACWRTQPTHLLVAPGKGMVRLAAVLGIAPLAPGDTYSIESLTIHALPFLAQDDFDHVLWACDINIVRGEDSFVRAQWASLPVLWQIYRQEEDAHMDKLAAWLDGYLAAAGEPLAGGGRALMHAFNTLDDEKTRQAWQQLLPQLGQWRAHARRWAEELALIDDLASQLSSHAQKRLQ